MKQLNDWAEYDAYTEAYEVTRTMELVGKNRGTYRVEIVRALAEGGAFAARYQVKRDGAWVDYEAGWVNNETEDGALGQALGLLALALGRQAG